MDWGAFLLVVVGGLLTAIGGFIGQWWSARQSAARDERDRRHEHLVWVRQLGYQGHIGFLTEFERKWNSAVKAEVFGFRDEGAEPEYDYLSPLHDRLTVLRTVSNRQTIDAAERALDALSGYIFGPPNGSVEEGRDLYLAALSEEFGLKSVLPDSEVESQAGR